MYWNEYLAKHVDSYREKYQLALVRNIVLDLDLRRADLN